MSAQTPEHPNPRIAAAIRVQRMTGDVVAAFDAYDTYPDAADSRPPAQDVAPATREDEIRAEARQARLAREKWEEEVEDAYALLESDPERFGFPAEEVRELLPEEALKAIRARTTDTDPFANDFDANADAAHNACVRELDARWWSLSEQERRETAAELGLDYDELHARKRSELERW